MDATLHHFRSPRAVEFSLYCRPGTNDRDVAYSIINEDEYAFAGLALTGTALDVGAHIGAATLLLVLTNPDLRVIAIEPVPENVEMIRRNLALNGVGGRVIVLHAAAGDGHQTINYLWRGSTSHEVHRYIGNQHFAPGSEHDSLDIEGYTLSRLVEMAGGTISLLKIDCEGCEIPFLNDPAVAAVERIHGEVHHGPSVRVINDKEAFLAGVRA